MPLEEATTASLEALKAYSAGLERCQGAGYGAPLFERAVAIDPDFAMAHARVGFGYSTWASRPWRGRATQGLPAARSGQRRRALLHRTLYDRDVTGNLERELRTLKRGPKATRAMPFLTG